MIIILEMPQYGVCTDLVNQVKSPHVGRHPAQRPRLSGDQLSSNFCFQGKTMYTNYWLWPRKRMPYSCSPTGLDICSAPHIIKAFLKYWNSEAVTDKLFNSTYVSPQPGIQKLGSWPNRMAAPFSPPLGGRIWVQPLFGSLMAPCANTAVTSWGERED